MLTESQEQAMKLIKSWYDAKGQLLRIGGPAGSGKSYLIPSVVDLVGADDCILMTPTGKAANNLVKAGMFAKTIHSTIYRVIDADEDFESGAKKDSDSSTVHYVKKPDDYFDGVRLFIVDEGSMVGGSLLNDILSFKVPVLLFGDPHQLAPVNDVSVFTHCDFYLTEIVRQAADNPIIWLSQQILAGNLPKGGSGTCWVRDAAPTLEELLYADMVLVDRNDARQNINTLIRPHFVDDATCRVAVGDKLICRTNDSQITSSCGYALTNGTAGVVTEVLRSSPRSIKVALFNEELGSYTISGALSPLQKASKQLPITLEYSYAITVHLSQGSEWDKVIYSMKQLSNKRALYTAVTRAKASLLVTLN